MDNQNILFDLNSPKQLLSYYRFLLRKQDKNRKRALYAAAERLLSAYEKTRAEILKFKSKGFIAWLRNRAALTRLESKLNNLLSELNSWLNKTIKHFVSFSLNAVLIQTSRGNYRAG